MPGLSSSFEKMKNSYSALRVRLLLMNVRWKLEAAELAGYTATFDERFVESLPGMRDPRVRSDSS